MGSGEHQQGQYREKDPVTSQGRSKEAAEAAETQRQQKRRPQSADSREQGGEQGSDCS